MKIKKIAIVFFSPTDSTRTVLEQMAESLHFPVERIDITPSAQRENDHHFTSDTLVFLGAPVYGGRIPALAVESMQKIHGQQTPAVLVVTYGNRAYEDALLEMQEIVEPNGLLPIAAAALVTEHSIMHSVACGRPDAEDKQSIMAFMARVEKKIQNAQSIADFARVEVPGNHPYREYGGAALKPKATRACSQCGICAAQCPAAAIPVDHPEKTDHDRCISCMRCMKVCPVQARKLPALLLSAAEKAFAAKYSARKEPAFFTGSH
ncbi:MAG: EFR1 family ferrodoxin [Clostridia bacterium]